MTYKRKLIEVALPLDAINRESAREKSIRRGHPSTLHLWWARRPLAACRAVLFASLVDDPSADTGRFPTEEAQETERQRLFRIIEELVKWENTTNERVLDAARAEIMRSCDGKPPPVCDPFCGGGSIPLEAQRLGLTAYASDLNPVAVLITKALVEIPPKFAGQPPVHPDDGKLKATGAWKGTQGLAEDVRYYGKWMRGEAERRIGHLYPKMKLPPEHGGGETTVIAGIWARTIGCPNPACGAEMPLVSSLWLSKKKGRETWLRPVVDSKRVTFTIVSGGGCPPDPPKLGQGARFRCLVCQQPAPADHVHSEVDAHRSQAQLMAVVANGPRHRVYLAATEQQKDAARVGIDRLSASDNGTIPGEPARGTFGGNAQGRRYGFKTFSDYFTDRQLVLLRTLTGLVVEAREKVLTDGAKQDYADAVATYLGLASSRLVDSNNSLCSWSSSRDQTRNLFARQAISMVWDYVENNPFAGAAGDLSVSVSSVARAVESLPGLGSASVAQADAAAHPFTHAVVSTDPPYYDNIGYSDLADFFYVWLRRSLREVFPHEFSTLLTPKSQELVANPYRFHGDRSLADQHFESGLSAAFRNMRSAQLVEFPSTVYYGFKQSEEDSGLAIASTGWEVMLEGLLREGFMVTGTWPVRTERDVRSISLGTNALASSIVLVCRPRPDAAPLATRKELLTALKSELPSALRKLQQGNIAPIDLAQSAIGPGMAVFSRYSKVVEADGSAMAVRTALGLINQVLDETLSEQESDFDGDSRWALAWFEDSGMNPGPFGRAETLSKAKNTAISGLVQAGFLESKSGKVRLLDRSELADSWDPASDARLTVWEVTQNLIKGLESGGEVKAAELLRRVGGLGETARELAYRLYVICERKKWAKEALAYNSLVVAWPEIARLAAGTPTAIETRLF